MKVLLATSNRGKLDEAREILHGSPLEIVTMPMWLGDVETGVTYLSVGALTHSAPTLDLGLDLTLVSGDPTSAPSGDA